MEAGHRFGNRTIAALSSSLTFPDPLHAHVSDDLDAERYRRVTRVLERLGGTPSDRWGTYEFPTNAQNVVDVAIATRSTSAKAHLDAVHAQSPGDLARTLVRAASCGSGMRALEPSAGLGSIVLAMQEVGTAVTAVERSLVRREHLLLKVLKGRDRLVGDADFATCQLEERFDRVVMFPPPVRSGEGDHLDHVRRAFAMLKPRGILIAVLPSTLWARADERSTDFTTWCRERGEVVSLDLSAIGDLSISAVRLEAPRRDERGPARSRS